MSKNTCSKSDYSASSIHHQQSFRCFETQKSFISGLCNCWAARFFFSMGCDHMTFSAACWMILEASKAFRKEFHTICLLSLKHKESQQNEKTYEKVNLEIQQKSFNASRNTFLRFQKVFPTTQPSLNFKIALGWKAVFKDVQATLQWACAARTLESELCTTLEHPRLP